MPCTENGILETTAGSDSLWSFRQACGAHHEQLGAKDDVQDEALQQQHTRPVDVEVQAGQPHEGDHHLQPHFRKGASSVVPQHIAVLCPRLNSEHAMTQSLERCTANRTTT